jgi:hypothetical protein
MSGRITYHAIMRGLRDEYTGEDWTKATMPIVRERPKSKNVSAFKGKVWGDSGKNATIVRKQKKVLTK